MQRSHGIPRDLFAEGHRSFREWLAAAGWTIALAIAAVLLVRGHVVADCWHVYASAAKHWRTHAPLYDLRTIDDFQYFPQAAIAFVPVEALGRSWSGVVWRALGWALYGHALWRIAGLGWAASRDRVFFVATIVVLPAATTSLMNGQANLHVAALMMHAAVDLREQRRWRVAVWLTVGLALKPLMLVMLLLTCVFDPSMIWRLAVTLGLLAALPFAAGPAPYVMSQYRDCAQKLAMSARPDRFFEDLRGLLWRLGWEIPYALLRALGFAAAVAAAISCRRMRRRWDWRDASLFVFALAAVYLMLFNSRNQANSYVILAPAAAVPAALFAWTRHVRAALVLSLIVACFYGSAIPLTAHWLKPSACIVFCVLLVQVIERARAAPPVRERMNSSIAEL